MSWLFSQALVEEYWQDKCSDGEPSAQSSGKPIPQAYLQRDKTTATWSRFPSGMTCELLTADRGKAVLMSFLAAFPAKTSQPQEKAQASTVSDPACGWKWPASSVKYDPDSSSWKTRQCSLLGDLVEFSETWPRWGSMRNGECWEQETWALRTSETESGLWPTPTARDYRGSFAQESSALQARMDHPRGVNLVEEMQRRTGSPGLLNPRWLEWLMGWPIGWVKLKPLETDKSHSVPQPPLSKVAGG